MDIQYIIVHCSDTPNGRYHTAEDIHRWHLERGWDGIGYHSVIRTDGRVDQGRPLYWRGSHTVQYNDIAIGVCLVGRDEFSDAQWRSLEGLIISLKHEFPNAHVVGHCNLDSHKTCPNFDVQKWWKNITEQSFD